MAGVPKAKRNEGVIREMEAAISGKIPSLLTAMYDLAIGVVVEETLPAGYDAEGNPQEKIRVYREKPDRQALTWLMERVVGKTPERHELTGGDGEPFTLISWMPQKEAEEAGYIEVEAPKQLPAPEDEQT